MSLFARYLNCPMHQEFGTGHCEPGYLTGVIKLIGLAAKTDHSMTDAVLVVDALAIHKATFLDPKN